MPALASRSDLEARLGRSLTGDDATRADSLLDDVSASVRAYTGQTFTTGTSTARLRARGTLVRLPQRPVTSVTSVKDVDGNVVEFTYDAGSTLSLLSLPLRGWVDVEYAHGGTVPDVVKAVVCQVAARAFGAKAEQAGFTSEGVPGYTYSVGGAAAAGPLGFLPDELRVLDAYRVVGTSAAFG